MTDLPYKAEYAISGKRKAKCKGCKQEIEQGALRIAVMVQSAFHDNKQSNWHHDDCFFKKHRPATVSEIGNYIKLKSADQEKIKSAMEKSTGIVMPIEKPKTKSKHKKRTADDSNAESTALALKDYLVEYSKNYRATCGHCETKICKDEVRISKTVYDTEVGSKFDGQPLWHHVKCFAKRRSEFFFFAGGESLPGFDTLKKEDQDIVKTEIQPFNSDEVSVKILKHEPKNEQELKEEKEKEKKMEEQNKLFHEFKRALSELKKSDMEVLLKENSQQVSTGQDECLDRLADCMAFGILKPCPDCKQGQLVLDTFGYKCTGSISEWTKCSYVTQTPKRAPMIVPNAYAEGSIFKSYEPKTAVRLFEAAPRPLALVVAKNEATTTVKKELPTPPLKNLQFFLYGRLKDKEETKKRIFKLGGLVVSKLTDTTVAVVSTKRDVERMPDKMEEIKSKDIEVVEETFLDLIDKDGTIARSLEIVRENNIANWGSDPATRISEDVMDGKSLPKSGSMYVMASKSAIKLKIQGGTAVDPASKLQDKAHVYADCDGTKYTAVLSKTDIVKQTNSYYKMQVLESDDNKKTYWLFRSWGRTGTKIGGDKVEDCESAKDAVTKFEKLYMEKTANVWKNRNNFKKVSGRYYQLELDYGLDNVRAQSLVDSKCTLSVPVQKLVKKIFDENIMKETLLELQLDTEKMPLGNLSKKQIKSGYEILSDLLKLIEKGSNNQNKFIDATNRFFTLIPHDFGINNAPLLDNEELINTKIAMLDNLLEIEIAYSLLQTDSDEANPISAHYLKLKADIAPLLASSPEFEMIEAYMRNTHAATHSNYTLEIEQVFKVVREGEDKQFKPFKELHNRRLLWHGSRVTNFAGIISQGLRIAPPEAPVTGYMFGKGVYFADMVSKSANYCCTNVKNPSGLMLLCEVALGNMKECHRAEHVTLPPNMHSAWGVGRTQPDPAQNKLLDDGTIVPLGKPIKLAGDETSLLYNEFIVYDVAQVNVKYLLQLKFNHKY